MHIFMKHLLYLLITLIGCGIVLSSCQSRVKNSSFSNDTDTVNTIMESVDSTSIIEEQKRIAAEETRLQERKAELDKLSKNFNQKKDEFSDKTWIYPKDRPKYRNRNATYCYFMKQNNEVRNFRFVFQYVNSDWLFIEDLIFNIDGKVFKYTRLDFNTDCGGGRIWEWCDLQLTDIDLIRALEKAKSVKIKMNGDKYYDTRTLNSVAITSIQKTIKYYKALGGKFN